MTSVSSFVFAVSIALKLYKVSEKVSESKFQKETIWQTSLINVSIILSH